jgi:aspartyl-tRNA(Asn)/glutamyl-tRNA(Gln) amidotransferase subunit C
VGFSFFAIVGAALQMQRTCDKRSAMAESSSSSPPQPQPDPKISVSEVKHVAKLARLALDDATLAKFTGQLEQILEYVDQIGRLDVSAGVEPMAHAVPLHNVLREDIVESSLTIELVLRNAPETDGRFFKVPKVIGGDADSAG